MGERSFFLWKLTYRPLCRFSSLRLHFSRSWGHIFKDLLIWLVTGQQVCILGWVSDKCFYLLKPCNYIFQVSIFSTSTKLKERNDNIRTFLKSHYLCTGKKIKFSFIQEAWMYFFAMSQNSQIFCIINIMTFSKFA